jgi:hypothetical protein
MVGGIGGDECAILLAAPGASELAEITVVTVDRDDRLSGFLVEPVGRDVVGFLAGHDVRL